MLLPAALPLLLELPLLAAKAAAAAAAAPSAPPAAGTSPARSRRYASSGCRSASSSRVQSCSSVVLRSAATRGSQRQGGRVNEVKWTDGSNPPGRSCSFLFSQVVCPIVLLQSPCLLGLPELHALCHDFHIRISTRHHDFSKTPSLDCAKLRKLFKEKCPRCASLKRVQRECTTASTRPQCRHTCHAVRTRLRDERPRERCV